MIVYKLDVTFFCGVAWSNKVVSIIALNKFQLIRTFLRETQHMNEGRTQKQLWRSCEKYIEKEDYKRRASNRCH